MADARIRRAVRADATAIAGIYNHYVRTSTATFDTVEKTVRERESWITERGGRHPVLVFEDEGGRVIAWGALSPWSPRPAWTRTVETAVYVSPDHRGLGIGPRVLAALLDEAKAVGHHVLIAQIVGGNRPSIAMFERMGFVHAGKLAEVGHKFDRWLDVALMQLLIGPTEGSRPRDGGGDMGHLKFDVAKLERLNDPGRFDTLSPDSMWRALGAPDARTIVDIGAGTGLFAAQFARLAPHALVYAADIEQTMIDWMRENRPEVADGRMLPVLSEETCIPLDDAVADVVTTLNLHHELVDKVQTYREALRLLKRGGRLLAVDWAPVDSPKGPPIAIRASVEEAAVAIAEAGFEQIESHGGLPYAWMITARRP